jgi:MFS family permease
MLDAFDVMLYALVLASLMSDIGMTKGTAGLLGSATLVASALAAVMWTWIPETRGREL